MYIIKWTFWWNFSMIAMFVLNMLLMAEWILLTGGIVWAIGWMFAKRGG